MIDDSIKINHLRQLINQLTNEIAAFTVNHHLNEIDHLLHKRQAHIIELIALHTADFNKTELSAYLSDIGKRDKHIMAELLSQRDQIQRSLSTVGKIKHYLV